MDGRRSRYILEVSGWNREEDARDLRGNDLSKLIQNMTGLNAFEVKRMKNSGKVGKLFKVTRKRTA